MCCLDFNDLDLIFKVTGGLKYVKFSLSSRFLLNQLAEFHQTCMNLSLGQDKELLRFW